LVCSHGQRKELAVKPMMSNNVQEKFKKKHAVKNMHV